MQKKESVNFHLNIECIDKILGTNLEQGAELQNGLLVDLVVGVVKNQVTESVKTSEYDLYLLQLEEKNIEIILIKLAENNWIQPDSLLYIETDSDKYELTTEIYNKFEQIKQKSNRNRYNDISNKKNFNFL